MNDPTVIAAAIVMVLAALTTAVVTIINALGAIKDKQESQDSKIDIIAKDSEAIKGHVNSEKTAAQGREALLSRENEMLNKMLRDKEETAKLLAQAVVTVDLVKQISATPSSTEPMQVEVINPESKPVEVKDSKPSKKTAKDIGI